jgi:uncharacterized radical SAM superfamily Fe-S cluster-containing enzyme
MSAYCPTCKTVVPSERIERDNQLLLRTDCPTCGARESVTEHDAALYQLLDKTRRPHKPPVAYQTATARGCPFDCGLCPQHQQKSCVSLIEITERCNLNCPVCFAESGQGEHRPLSVVKQMLDAAVSSANGAPDVLQISGGEPTTHPELIEILRYAKSLPFKYVMLNTNGLDLQNGHIDLSDLKLLGLGFEVYLQFDGLDDSIYETLRGRPLLAQKMRTLDRLAEAGIPVTLVATIRRGLNDLQVGELLDFALAHPAVRGINFQCEAYFGRTPESLPQQTTQTEILNQLLQQRPELIQPADLLLLSCGLVTMSYLEKQKSGWRALSPKLAQVISTNPMTTTLDDLLNEPNAHQLLRELAKRLPLDFLKRTPAERSRFVHHHFFHLNVMTFLDGDHFDLDRASRECTHIIQPDGTKYPFSAFNTLHRGTTV